MSTKHPTIYLFNETNIQTARAWITLSASLYYVSRSSSLSSIVFSSPKFTLSVNISQGFALVPSLSHPSCDLQLDKKACLDFMLSLCPCLCYFPCPCPSQPVYPYPPPRHCSPFPERLNWRCSSSLFLGKSFPMWPFSHIHLHIFSRMCLGDWSIVSTTVPLPSTVETNEFIL